MMFSQDQILQYKNIFKGREDVFAVRWEKNEKNGYMPAYDLNWDEYAKHKASGGTLKDFANKTYSRLTEQRIINHLTGRETIGVYPLLEDNTSRFIVADFDQASSGNKKWTDECKLFINACAKHKLPAYLERSRSGNGGHVWIFFEQNYPAYKSRKILLHILESAGIISPLIKIPITTGCSLIKILIPARGLETSLHYPCKKKHWRMTTLASLLLIAC